MKREIKLIMLVVIFIHLTACATRESDTFYGDEITENTLIVCIDSMASRSDSYELNKELNELMKEIKSACSVEKLAFDVIPFDEVERTTKLQRLRTEIMAGGGPDVFLMRTVTGSYEFGYDEALFNFPEKSMEVGLFLPLDQYMENNTQFTDWSAQTQAVLCAGQTDEGQVVIPMGYTFPVLVYPKDKVKAKCSSELTMREILANPETVELGAVLYSDLSRTDISGSRGKRTDGLCYILGKYGDFENEELLFTEDDMYETMITMNSLHDTIEDNKLQYIESDAEYQLIYELGVAYFDSEMTLIPTYSMNGGVTASICSYAAINRNTKLPEEAFSVIDYLMCEEAQCKSILYSDFFARGIPLQNNLGSSERILRANYYPHRYMDMQYFDDLLAIKKQITAVNFESKLDFVMKQLMRECHESGTISREDISEAYEKMDRMMGE